VLGTKDFDEVIHRDNLSTLVRGDSMPTR
jgi:hypothetical protein